MTLGAYGLIWHIFADNSAAIYGFRTSETALNRLANAEFYLRRLAFGVGFERPTPTAVSIYHIFGLRSALDFNADLIHPRKRWDTFGFRFWAIRPSLRWFALGVGFGLHLNCIRESVRIPPERRLCLD